MSSTIARVVYVIAMALVSPEMFTRIQSLGYILEESGPNYIVGYLWPEGHHCSTLPKKPMTIAPGGEFKIELILPSGEKRRSPKLSHEGKVYSIKEERPRYETGFVSTLPILYTVQIVEAVVYTKKESLVSQPVRHHQWHGLRQNATQRDDGAA
jgi:hypothetical protein